MKILSLLFFAILFQGFINPNCSTGKSKYADLQVLEIKQPKWDDLSESTIVYVEIINGGKEMSLGCTARLFDIGINGNGKEVRIEAFTAIPELEAGQKAVLKFVIKNHWVYDPNCEIEVKLDAKNKVKESNERNNSKQFFEEG